MEKLKVGETATLENGKEYICFGQTIDEGKDYVYLVSNFKPLEIRFAVQTENGDNLDLEIVTNKVKKQYLFELFKTRKK